MRTFLALVVVSCMTSAAFGAIEWSQQQQTVKVTPMEKDAMAEFSFVNRSDRPVTIKSIRSSCGCTSAELPKSTFAAGEKGALKATFNIGSRVGVHVKTIKVTTDEPGEPEYHVTFRVDVPEVVRVHPRFVHWTKDEPRNAKVIEITAPDPKYPIQIRGIAASDDGFTGEILKVQEGRKYQLRITPPKAGTGSMTITTDQPGRHQQLQVHLRAFGDPTEAAAGEVTESGQPRTANAFRQQR